MSQAVTLTSEQKDIHNKLLTHLLRVRDKLMLLDPNNLTLDEHIRWNELMYQTGLAISKVEGAILSDISSRYASQLPEFEIAIQKLNDDLYYLKKTNDVIEAVSSTLGIITDIVLLLD